MRDEGLLRRSEELLAKLFRNSPAAIALVSQPEGVVLDVNDAYERLFGWTRAEAVGQTTAALRVWVDAHDRARLQEQLAASGRVTDFASRARRKNGEVFDSLVSCELIEEAGRRMLLVIVLDVSARRRAEDALRLSDERLRQAVRVADIGIFDHDHAAGTIYWSPEQRRIYGVGPAEPITFELFLRHVHPEDAPRIGAAAAHAHDPAGDGLFDVEHRVVRSDGAVRWVSTRSQTTFAGEGEARRPLRTIGAVIDVTERKAAEAALLASEERFAKMFRESPEAMTLVRAADGSYLDVNREFERQTGYAREEVLGRTSLDVGLWQAPHEREAMLRAMRERGGVANLEFSMHRRDGSTRQTVVHGATLEIAGQSCWLFVLRDITERKRAEETRALLAAVFETSSDAIILSDPGRRIVSWSPGAERVLGWRSAEAVGQELKLIVPPELWHETTGNLELMKKGVAPLPFEAERLAKDGRRLHMHISVSGVYGPQGELKLIAGIYRDVTERKRAELALRESEQRFRALVDLSSDWYWVTDEEHRFTFREGEILRRMGIPPEADYGRRRWEMDFLNMSEADWAAHRALLARREEFRDLLLERRSPDGRVHWATISGRPLYDAAGRFIGYHGTGRDVTQQALAEQRLRQFNVELERKVVERTEALDAAMKELEAFSYSVSHDLRAPLRAIDGFSRMLEERSAAALDDEARGHLQRVRAAARRMALLIEDLLEFSRIGRAEFKRGAIDLSALAWAVAKELESGAPERRAEWRIAEGLEAHADPGLARVVLENLLGNAWKYTSRVSRPLIEFGRTEAGEFVVRDNGAGFDMAYSEGLFQPFRRLHSPQEFDGTGIGLATVKRIVERHGGTVRAEGKVGAGAAFFFTLPGDDAPPAPRARQ